MFTLQLNIATQRFIYNPFQKSLAYFWILGVYKKPLKQSIQFSSIMLLLPMNQELARNSQKTIFWVSQENLYTF